MEEAIATSQLEGAATTRKVAKDMLRSGRAPRNKGEQMIVNGYRTISMLRERAHEPLTIELIHDIQQSMTQDTLDDPSDAVGSEASRTMCAWSMCETERMSTCRPWPHNSSDAWNVC